MATKKTMTGLRLNESMYAKVKYLSQLEGRTMSNFIEMIVRRYLENYERQHGEIDPHQS